MTQLRHHMAVEQYRDMVVFQLHEFRSLLEQRISLHQFQFPFELGLYP